MSSAAHQPKPSPQPAEEIGGVAARFKSWAAAQKNESGQRKKPSDSVRELSYEQALQSHARFQPPVRAVQPKPAPSRFALPEAPRPAAPQAVEATPSRPEPQVQPAAAKPAVNDGSLTRTNPQVRPVAAAAAAARVSGSFEDVIQAQIERLSKSDPELRARLTARQTTLAVETRAAVENAPSELEASALAIEAEEAETAAPVAPVIAAIASVAAAPAIAPVRTLEPATPTEEPEQQVPLNPFLAAFYAIQHPQAKAASAEAEIAEIAPQVAGRIEPAAAAIAEVAAPDNMPGDALDTLDDTLDDALEEAFLAATRTAETAAAVADDFAPGKDLRFDEFAESIAKTAFDENFADPEETPVDPAITAAELMEEESALEEEEAEYAHFDAVLSQALQAEETQPILRSTSADAALLSGKMVALTVRLTPEDCREVRLRAAQAGLSISAYLRACALEVEQLRSQVKHMIADLREAEAAQPIAAAPVAAAPIQPQHPGLLHQLAGSLRRLIPLHITLTPNP